MAKFDKGRFEIDGIVYYAYNKKKYYFVDVWKIMTNKNRKHKDTEIITAFVRYKHLESDGVIQKSEYHLVFEPQVGCCECWVIKVS